MTATNELTIDPEERAALVAAIERCEVLADGIEGRLDTLEGDIVGLRS